APASIHTPSLHDALPISGQDAEMTLKALQAANGLRAIEIEGEAAIAALNDDRDGEEWLECFGHDDWPCPGPTRAVGRRKCLVHRSEERRVGKGGSDGWWW